MEGLYALAVKLSLSMGSLPSQVATGVRLFSGLESQMLKTAAASEKLNLAIKAMAWIGAGGFVASAGFGLLGFLDKAAQKAMALQQIMVDIQQTTGATPGQITQLQATSTTVGMRTALSQIQVAQVQQASVHAGLSASQANTLAGPLARFAMIQMFSRGVSPAQSGGTATEFAHIFRAYDPENMGVMTDYLARALSITPDSPRQFQTLVSQFAGSTALSYGSNRTGWIRDSLTMATLFSQMGQGSRAGTQYARLLQQLFKGGHGAAPTAVRYLEALTHTQFADAHGQFIGADRLVTALSSPALQKMSPVALENLLGTAFGSLGLRLAGSLSAPVIGGRLRTLHNAFNTNIDANAYLGSPKGKIRQLQADMETIQTKLGPAMANLLDNLGKGLIALAGLFIVGGAGMIIINGLALLKTVMRALKFGALADPAIAFPEVAIAVGVLVYAMAHWQQITKPVVDAFGWLATKAHDSLKSINPTKALDAWTQPMNPAANRAEVGNWIHQTFGIGGGAPVSVHIEHVHGTDRQTAHAVAREIAQHLHDSLHHDSAAPHGLQPGFAGR